MKQYQSFIFDSYDFDPKTGKIELHYSLDDEIRFTEKLTFRAPFVAPPCHGEVRSDNEPRTIGGAPQDDTALDEALKTLHLAGGASYYKTCIPKNIEVQSTQLNEDQAQFWNTVYENGLGEFFFRNDINFQGLINFPISEKQSTRSALNNQHAPLSKKKTLIPIGGGKDSIVTIEKLRKEDTDITLLRLNAHPLINQLVEKTELPCITVERELDPQLFKLNGEGALNGHIPITAYLSALCVVVAEAYGFDSITMSNEKSANEGNVEFHGKTINHQWSKSEEFEKMFQAYITNNIDPDLKYWSPLRNMSELEVAEEFSKYPEYFELFTSCNRNWKLLSGKLKEESGKWCRKCPKCAFVFAILAAYLTKDQLMKIFGGNLFEDVELLPTYRQLLGLEGFKPLECVGTPEETMEALRLAHKKGDLDGTVVMEMFVNL